MADIVEHLSDENLTRTIAQVFRVLKPGGRCIVLTEPTVLYKKIGQYFVKDYFSKKGTEWLAPTILEESLITHINIQSKASLSGYLTGSFGKDKVRVFYAPINSEGKLKRIVSAMRLWCIFSPHLWAIAKK